MQHETAALGSALGWGNTCAQPAGRGAPSGRHDRAGAMADVRRRPTSHGPILSATACRTPWTGASSTPPTQQARPRSQRRRPEASACPIGLTPSLLSAWRVAGSGGWALAAPARAQAGSAASSGDAPGSRHPPRAWTWETAVPPAVLAGWLAVRRMGSAGRREACARQLAG